MQRDGLLVPPLTVSDYPEEQIGNKEEDTGAQADDPATAESRLICGEFGPSILFGDGLDNLQHQRFAVLLIAHQDHAITLLLISKTARNPVVAPGCQKYLFEPLPAIEKPSP